MWPKAALIVALIIVGGADLGYSSGEPSPPPKITEATLTEIDEFPWTAMLIYASSKNSGCGGALISSSFVITVARCLTGRILEDKGALKYVRLAEFNMFSDPDCIVQGGVQDCTIDKVDLKPKRVIVHPQYERNSLNQHHDIGLIELPQQVEFSDFIKPINLPEASHNNGAITTAGTEVTVCGWGRTSFSQKQHILSPVKLKTTLQLVDNGTCRKQIVDLGSGQICAGGGRHAGYCAGDSGSPLMYYDRKESRWILVGLLSLGPDACGMDGKPGIYSKVSKYVAWIEDNSGM